MSVKSALRATFGTSAGGGFDAPRRAHERAELAAKHRKQEATRRARVDARIAGVRAAERRKSDARVARLKASRPSRRTSGHDYRTCRDDDCQRPACEAYREGYADGQEAGYAAGYSAGQAAAS
jgi:hypothetical protein